jgi:hypothetical protein
MRRNIADGDGQISVRLLAGALQKALDPRPREP